jgi:hypothetical protein
MNVFRRWTAAFSLTLLLSGGAITLLTLSIPACASLSVNKPPLGLSPAAKEAWYATRVIEALDILRDTAIDANAQTPPLVSTVTTRQIVTYHKSSITFIHSIPGGWKASVVAGITELENNLPLKEYEILKPYTQLVKAALAEVR